MLLAASALWILHFFHTTPYIRTACVHWMSWAVGVFWTALLIYFVAGVVMIWPAFTLIELLLVVAIIAILFILIMQSAGPAIKQAWRARRVMNGLGRILTILGIVANPQSPKSATTGLRDFFVGNGWSGVSPDQLAQVAAVILELIAAEEDYTATSVHDWLKTNNQADVLAPFIDQLIQRIEEVLGGENDLTEEKRRQLQQFLERLRELKDVHEAANAGAGD